MLGGDDGILSASGINIVHLNVASILGAHKFEMMSQQIEMHNIDIFCASETWLTSHQPNGLVGIRGFNVARLDRAWHEDGVHAQLRR